MDGLRGRKARRVAGLSKARPDSQSREGRVEGRR